MIKGPVFDPIEFAEFIGERGADVTIVRFAGITATRVRPMPHQQFRALMMEYLRAKAEEEKRKDEM